MVMRFLALASALVLAAAPCSAQDGRSPLPEPRRGAPATPQGTPGPGGAGQGTAGATGGAVGAAAARDAEAKRLLEALGRAPDESSAAPIEARLRGLWAQRGSPAARLLLAAAARSIRGGALDSALEDLDAAITLQPDDPQAWILRAQANGAAGDSAEAARDLQRALRLDPTRFDALVALSAVQEEAKDLPGALRSFEAALRLNPHLDGGQARLRDLRRRALGDNT